jgi:hypothetical protein
LHYSVLKKSGCTTSAVGREIKLVSSTKVAEVLCDMLPKALKITKNISSTHAWPKYAFIHRRELNTEPDSLIVLFKIHMEGHAKF